MLSGPFRAEIHLSELFDNREDTGVQKAELTGTLIQRTTTEAPHGEYVLHRPGCSKKTISYCIQGLRVGMSAGKARSGPREAIWTGWMKTLPQPWSVAMEATIFTGWILRSSAAPRGPGKVAHPLMLRASAAAKRRNDRLMPADADGLRCDFLPECHIGSNRDSGSGRRTLRYRIC